MQQEFVSVLKAIKLEEAVTWGEMTIEPVIWVGNKVWCSFCLELMLCPNCCNYENVLPKLINTLCSVRISWVIAIYFQSLVYACVSHSTACNSLRPHGLYPTRLPCPCSSPGKNIGVSCHSLLQGVFPTQELNLGLPHCGQILYHLSHVHLLG